MSWIKRLASSLRGQRLEDDLNRELEFHLAMRTREKTDCGVPPDEARRQALARFGSVDRAREGCRDHSTFAWVASLRQDLRYAARNLGRNRGFAAAAIACLAIGVGANTAVFSFVNAFFFPSLPPRVYLAQRASGNPISYPELRDWQRLNRQFEDVFAYTPGARLTIGRGPGSTSALGETVTGNYFRALGVQPLLGRLLAPGDESRAVAVLGYRFWRNHFAGDRNILGQTVWMNREPFLIAGVAPAYFQGMLAPWSTDVWVTPYLQRDTLSERGARFLVPAVRLKSGVTPAETAGALNSLDRELARAYPDPRRPAHDPLTVSRRSGLSGSPVWGVFLAMGTLLMAVTGIIFLIACANVAGLLIARSTVRRREILIRLSLGAGRGRLVRQLLTESLLLSLLGGAAGTGIAFAAGDLLAGMMPRSITGGFQFQHAIDLRVLAFTLALSVAGVIVAGWLPALRASDQNLAAAGRSSAPSASRTPLLRQWLIAGQVAASVLVLGTAGLFVRSLQATAAANPGFESAYLLTATLDLRDLHYPGVRNSKMYLQLRDRVAALPGVRTAALADALPLSDQHTVAIPGQGDIADARVDASYFRAMRIPVVRGREPYPGEKDVAVVNQALAARLWPGADPIGQTIRLGNRQPAALPVIGLTATGKYWSLNEPPRPFLYRVFADPPGDPGFCLAIRTAGPPEALAEAVAAEIARLDPDLPAMRVLAEKQRQRLWLEPERSAAVLLSILGMGALGLAITGLYALLAQLVALRTAEIAVRVALGASRRDVAGMFLRRSAILTGAGAVVGIAAFSGISRVLATFAGPLPGLDPVIVAGIAILLAVVGITATLVPAYRAVRIAPAAALRAE